MLGLVAATLSLTLQPTLLPTHNIGLPRHAPAQACEKPGPGLEKRDSDVERETGQGWASLIPNPTGLVFVAAIGVVSALAGDSPLGRALNGPVFTRVESPEVDAAGTAFDTATSLQASSGLFIVIAYNVVARFVRPKIEEMAQEKREASAVSKAAATSVVTDSSDDEPKST